MILALLLMSVLSALAASLMFLSQTETYASMNYRMMSQARYAAESAVQKAANFLLDPTQYAPPGTTGDPLSNYNRTVSPVTYSGQPVILSASSSQASNYPSSTVQSAFNSAAQGTLTAGNTTLTFSAYATLLSMRVFDSYGGGQAVVQTWLITADGGISGSPTKTVEVSATVENPKVPANSFAAFATGSNCGALYLHGGNTQTGSYDSTNMAAGAPPSIAATGGNVGTNGNLKIQGSVTVDGNLSTPRTGVGSCTSGAVDALSEVGSATITGSINQLPAVAVYPTPYFSATPPTTSVTINAALLASPASACSSLNLTLGTNCTVDAAAQTVTVNGNGSDVTMPNVTTATGYTLIFVGHSPQANNINVNSLSGNIQINANQGATDVGDSVVLKIAGLNPDGSYMSAPFSLDGFTINSNFPFDASTLQIVYGGNASIIMAGNNSAAATVYAPNAAFALRGSAAFYGSILANTVDNGGNPGIYYDQRLMRDFYVTGHPMLSAFTWKRY
jgi:hypothetical protein